MNFFKSFLASLLGTFIALGLISILFFTGIAAIATSINFKTVDSAFISENSVLNIDLNTSVRDRSPAFNPFGFFTENANGIIGMDAIIGSINKAKKDEKIKGIRLNSGLISSGWAQAREIRNCLNEFKKSGKFIYAYADFMSQKGYYVSSVADSIFMNPVGSIELKGLSSEVLYFEDFQNQYGLKMEVIRHGKYKSAVEPFLQDKMSDENRAQIKGLLDAVWTTISDEIVESRAISKKALEKMVEELTVTDAKEAITNGIIDALVYEDDFEKSIKAALEIDKDDSINSVEFYELNTQMKTFDSDVKDQIAVIYANGPILYTSGTEEVIGKKALNQAFQEVETNKNIKGAVLRIDSPGGDAMTSEIILNAMRKLKGKKPLVVSLGNIAASGGYYIACLGDKIYASPMTITGSIGVLAAFPNMRGLAERIGINAEQVNSHKNAMGYSLFEPLNDGFKNSTKSAIEKVYTTFKSRVSEGRSLNMEKVEDLSKGRIWSGKDAVENGLVDAIGGLEDAIQATAEMAAIENYNIDSYPKYENEFEYIFLDALSFIRLKIFNHPIEKFASELIKLSEMEGIQAIIPFSINIE
ncbi:MAG: signal peptide peptidase SppA [Flavobacteriaceae bacterium]|nr:signal peptide peptidase SppA [Flavobacteriaceae bacterium]